MGATVKTLKGNVTLFCQIEQHQHEALRTTAFKERKSIAKVVREALDLYFKHKRKNV